MYLSDVLLTLQNDLRIIGEDILLVKEPNENDVDIDVLISHRSRSVVGHLIKKSRVPLYFSHKNRGFAYYISQSGFIKAIDLYDAPFITDSTISWFFEHSEVSQCNSCLYVLSQNSQLIYFLYKALKKDKPKSARFERIASLAESLTFECAQKSLLDLCDIQDEPGDFIQKAIGALQYLYAQDCNFETFSEIIRIHPSDVTQTNILEKCISKVKHWIAGVEHNFFHLKLPQDRLPIVSIVGVDGVGKSTTVARLNSSSGKLNALTTRMEIKTCFHPLCSLYFKYGKRLLHLITKMNIATYVKGGHKFETSADLCVLKFDTHKKINSFYQNAQDGRIVIIDRWWSDFFIAKKREDLLKNHPKLLHKFLSLPRPDLFVLIEIPADVSMKRRPEEDPEVLLYKKNKLSSFMNQHFKSSLLVLNGTDDIEHNVKAIHREVYKQWCRRAQSTKAG